MTAMERWAVLLMDGSPKPEVHHGWYVEGDEETAEAFRAFVNREIDPAVKVRLRCPVTELLSWRLAVAVPSQDGSVRS